MAAWRRIHPEGVRMGIEDIVNQGKKLYEDNKEQVDGFLKSEQAEQVSDQVFDSAADLAKKISPDQFDATVDDLRDKADGAVGND
ncbi:hypothetical protein ACH3VR_17440 [Microbacterium sp. B2969]|uniref:Antitoxin n=1 Tax=Microbacterium alkaliflavum TaxID=3248839 RepID=A0ABW7QCP9_9MICO